MNTQTALKLIRYKGLVEAGIVENRTTLGRWIKANQFPKPIKLGPNSVAWRLSAIEKWLDSREA